MEGYRDTMGDVTEITPYAAKELLVALKAVVKDLELIYGAYHLPSYFQAAMAIAKAEGRHPDPTRQ
jgi:hypothetical protein